MICSELLGRVVDKVSDFSGNSPTGL
uniref:Uncharacterized protein n=1 Tax=Arundo donax TaxID=35708 RepID=A0A0A9B1B0_ARUDO